MMLPITDQMPASRRHTAVRPNGHTTNPASRNEAMPKGIVTIRMHARIARDDVADGQPEAGEDEPEDVADRAHAPRLGVSSTGVRV